MKLISTYGFRWSYIATRFNGKRTEHMVKNRYNSFIKIWRKKKNQTNLNPSEDHIDENIKKEEEGMAIDESIG
jgi:hypothetical protein